MTDQPNIVLFMTDQLRADALGCYGNEVCPTPNLNRFAQNGLRFDSAFTTSPVCSPSRASLMTGLYAHNHGVMFNTHIGQAFSRGLDPATPTFASALKATGYQLDYVGKWHVHEDRDPTEYGFDRYEPGGGKRGQLEGSEIEIDFLNGSYPVAATSPHAPEELAPAVRVRRGLEMIDERVTQGAPFFVRIDVLEPHFACVPPEPYASLVDPAKIPPWPNFDESFVNKPESHQRKHREWNLEAYNWDWWSQVVAKYYGVVSYVDACFGDLLRGLEMRGLNENTIVLFSSDHGDAMGSHKHFEKAGTLYDEVYRVPLLMSGPERWVQQGGVCTDFVRLLDLAPTLAEWAGTSFETPIDGISAAPLAAGRNPSDWPDAIYAEHHGEVWGYHSQRMVRTHKWKYGWEPNGLDELYDLRTDPYELVNLIGEAEHADTITEMRARLHGWIDATADQFSWPWIKMNLPDPIAPQGIPIRNMKERSNP